MPAQAGDSGRLEQFQAVLDSLHSGVLRPEVLLTEAPAPLRLAPFALAFTAEVLDPEGAELASGRLVVLHDPEGHDTWQGASRLVTFVRAAMEPEIATDPFLPGVAWDWLLEALANCAAAYVAASGTVTRTVSESFGDLAEEGGASGVEIRASWTPVETDLRPHVAAWCELLCAATGLPPAEQGASSAN